jgi:hypothetical protein
MLAGWVIIAFLTGIKDLALSKTDGEVRGTQ